MGLEKAIKSGKEHRRQYGTHGDFAKAVDKMCRNHGGCFWCQKNRSYNTRKRKQKADYKEE